MYVAIEGVDTAGKSTQIALLKEHYGKSFQFIKEPGATKAGLKLRKLLLDGSIECSKAELLLFLADRALTIEEHLKERDANIISDRSLISGIAYAREYDMNFLIELNHFATDGVFPQKAVLLQLSPEELTRRLASKSGDCIEQRGIAYLLEIQERMKEVVERVGIESLCLDAALPKEAIFEEICAFIATQKREECG